MSLCECLSRQRYVVFKFVDSWRRFCFDRSRLSFFSINPSTWSNPMNEAAMTQRTWRFDVVGACRGSSDKNESAEPSPGGDRGLEELGTVPESNCASFGRVSQWSLR